MSVDHRTLFYVLRYLGRISKEDFTASFGKHSVTYTPAERVEINLNFFKSALCRRCGCCCQPGISTIATVSDIDRVLQNIKQVGHDIPFTKQKLTLDKNGEVSEVDWYVSGKMKRGKHCELMFTNDKGLTGCKVQSFKVVNCYIPLLYIARNCNQVKANLTKRMHGTIWVPGCTAHFDTFNYNEFLQDIEVLKRLQLTAKDLGLKTWMPEIIQWCEENKTKLKSGELPQAPVVIYQKKKENQIF